MSDNAQPDPYAFWQARLKGQNPEHTRGRIEWGFWRIRQRDGSVVPVRTWRDVEDRPAARIGTDKGIIIKDEEAWAERTFAYALMNPVTVAAYNHFMQEGRWPEDVPDIKEQVAARLEERSPGMGHNAPPEDILTETIRELRHEADMWLTLIGGKIETQEQADKASNFADRFAELEKEADRTRTTEKAPVLKAQREIDGKWQPVVRSAQENKRWAKDIVAPFLRAEMQRKAKELAEKAQAGETVRPEDLKVKAGTRGRSVSLRTTKVVKLEPGRFDDLWKHYEHDSRFRNHPEVTKALVRLAEADLLAGKPVPGAYLEDSHTAA